MFSKRNAISVMILVTALLVASSMTLAADKISPTPDKPITLKMATFFQKNDIRQKYTEKWGAAITKATNGAIKFRYFPAQSLVRAKEMADSLRSGVIDATTFLVTAYTPEDFPFNAATFMIPLAIDDDYEKDMQLKDKAGDVINKAFAKHNIKPLWSMYTAYGQEWFFRTPVDEKNPMSMFKGKRLRSPGALAALQMMKFLGAERVAMSAPETYEAGQKGIIQGCTLGFSQYAKSRTYEVFPYILTAQNSFTFPGGIPCVMRLNLWNSLPNDIQQKIIEVSKPLEKEFYLAYRKEVDDLMSKLVKEGKIKQVVKLDASIKSEWRKNISKLVDEALLEKFPSQYPPLKNVIDQLQ